MGLNLTMLKGRQLSLISSFTSLAVAY